MKLLVSQLTRLLFNFLLFMCKAVIPKQTFAKPFELKLKVSVQSQKSEHLYSLSRSVYSILYNGKANYT